MMAKKWQTYLEDLIPMREIEQILIYTDSYREWVSNGLVDFALDNKIKTSVAMTDEYTEEDFEEITKSFIALSNNTLVVSIISDQNPNYLELKSIFPYYQSPPGFNGYSITFSSELHDSYVYEFLNYNYFDSINLLLDLREYISQSKSLNFVNSKGSNLKIGNIGDILNAPFFLEDKNKHISFPGTEIKIQGDYSIDGKLVLHGSIAPCIDNDGSLLDYFGKISEDESIEITIENNKIINIGGLNKESPIRERILYNFGNEIFDSSITEIILGIGPDIQQPGLYFIDRNTKGSLAITIKHLNLTIIAYESYFQLITS